MGEPTKIKTDNGPVYASSQFQQCCHMWNIQYSTGIPYNPQGQDIVDRAHSTLKNMLKKQKRGSMGKDPATLLAQALFTLNFKNLDDKFQSAIEKHFAKTSQDIKPAVLWKDINSNIWCGPNELLTWGRGYASVRTPSGPLQIPALCIKPYHGMARTQPGTRNEGTDLTGPTAPDDVASVEDTSPGHHLGMQSWNKSNDHLARQTCCCTHLYSSVN
ncbi:PREDICTED: endogenous retrovirus group K member 6 Pol protein-like [Cercocebus atys]|uniref:endogenous retrovirus group K member 6 Pol protein-like n=1 Tax=Cercocebus atys TaxID=9531 RepID=UPI0005F57EE1|nr:PREDICTED: endogenous retrovirus group K member 6 Pol protein-like [Cercocebus atys]